MDSKTGMYPRLVPETLLEDAATGHTVVRIGEVFKVTLGARGVYWFTTKIAAVDWYTRYRGRTRAELVMR